MTWNVYEIVLRLHSPMHLGWNTISYLRRTRPYVTGRVLRGALVNRVGRNTPNLVTKDPRDPFRAVSKTFAQYLTLTYFYPALKTGSGYQVRFPWDDEAHFRRRFLGSYAGTALNYPQQTAAEGLLREVEFISPRTQDTGEQVYLMGYVFVQDERCKKYDWRGAFERLQLGGERGYGWGLAVREKIEKLDNDNGQGEITIFDQTVIFNGHLIPGQKTRPSIMLPDYAHTWAHALSIGENILHGMIEPLVGREWRANNKEKNNRRHIGQHLAFNGLCYAPGAILTKPAAFFVEESGLWRWQEAD